jgi:hypothetical protein
MTIGGRGRAMTILEQGKGQIPLPAAFALESASLPPYLRVTLNWIARRSGRRLKGKRGVPMTRPSHPRQRTIREFTLEEMLADPLIRLVMARDGVKAREVRALMERSAAS